MGIQRLSDRKRAAIAADLSVGVVYAYANGGYCYGFVTDDHRHGWIHKSSREVSWETDPVHIHPICHEHWPEDMRRAGIDHLLKIGNRRLEGQR